MDGGFLRASSESRSSAIHPFSAVRQRSPPAIVGNVREWWICGGPQCGPTRTLTDVAALVRCGHDGPMKSETAKLPKGQSYPLRPSVLRAALADAGLSIDTHLIRSPGNLFDAHFWTPNENVPYERLYVRFGSVPSPDLASKRIRVEAEALPSLLRWIEGILALPSISPIRRESQRIDLSSLCHRTTVNGKTQHL